MLGLLERRWVRIPAYMFFALMCFLLSMLITFPDDRIKKIMSIQLEKQLEYEYEVEIEDLDLWWLMGIELEQVTLKERWTTEQMAKAIKEAKEGGKPRSQFEVTVPRIGARLAPLTSLFNLGLGVLFEVDFDDGGLISGTFVQASGKRKVDIDFGDVDLKRSKIVENLTGVPGFGSHNGTVALELSGGNRPEILGGSIDLKGSKLTVGPGVVETTKIPSMVYIEVAQTNFGNLVIKAKIEPPKKPRAARFVIEEMGAKGRDVLMDMWGNVQPAKRLGLSKSNMQFRLQFDQGFVKENELAPMLNLPPLRAGKSADNWYGFTLYGPVAKVKFKASTTTARGPGASKGGSKTGASKAPRGAAKKPSSGARIPGVRKASPKTKVDAPSEDKP